MNPAEGLTTATAEAVVEGKGVVAEAEHLVEIVFECLVEGEHRVVGEIVVVGNLARDYLFESGRGRKAPEGALIGIPSKVDGEGTPAPVVTGTESVTITVDNSAPTVAGGGGGGTATEQPPAPAPTAAQ